MSLAVQTGVFYTPPALAAFLTRWAVRPGDCVLDPSCGDGNFLVEALKLGARRVVGVEIDRCAAQEARRRLGSRATILSGDFFRQILPGTFDGVLGNPPYIRFQEFPQLQKKQALMLAREAGVPLSGESSAWAPMLVVAAQSLKPHGRAAFVLPREALFTSYAAPVRDWLSRFFSSVTLIVLDGLHFRGALEQVVLFLGERGGPRTGVKIRAVDTLEELHPSHPAEAGRVVEQPDRWRWAALNPMEREVFETARSSGTWVRLGDIAQIHVGVVTGACDYFVLTQGEARANGIRPRWLMGAITDPSWVAGAVLAREEFRVRQLGGSRCLLLAVPRGTDPNEDSSLTRYLHAGAHRRLPERTKCRARRPWYSVILGDRPDAFLSYCCRRRPRFALNNAGVTCTNHLHRVTFNTPMQSHRERIVTSFYNPVTLLGIELQGHVYGGGVLKIEPTDAQEIPIPWKGSLPSLGIIDKFLREDRLSLAMAATGAAIGLTPAQIRTLTQALDRLRHARLKLVRAVSEAWRPSGRLPA